MNIKTVSIEIIANKKEKRYSLVIIGILMLFILSLSLLIIDFIVLGLVCLVLFFLGLQVFHFYNGRVKIGELVLQKDSINVVSIEDDHSHFSVEELSYINLVKNKSFKEFSLFLAWGDGTNNYLQLHSKSNEDMTLRLFFKTDAQLEYTLLLLKHYNRAGIKVVIERGSNASKKLVE
jgi:hypothetical protein